MADQDKSKMDAMELFSAIGASDENEPASIKETAEDQNASKETTEFLEKLPNSMSEPSEIVEAAASSENNVAGKEVDLGSVTPSESIDNPELKIEDVTGEK